MSEMSHNEKRILERIERLELIIMSALSDLQTAVANLQAASANENSAVIAAIADIQSLPAADAALVPLTATIVQVAASTQGNADALNAAIAPAVVPTPAPAVKA